MVDQRFGDSLEPRGQGSKSSFGARARPLHRRQRGRPPSLAQHPFRDTSDMASRSRRQPPPSAYASSAQGRGRLERGSKAAIPSGARGRGASAPIASGEAGLARHRRRWLPFNGHRTFQTNKADTTRADEPSKGTALIIRSTYRTAPGTGGELRIARRWSLQPRARADVQSKFQVAETDPSQASWLTQPSRITAPDSAVVVEELGRSPQRLNSSTIPLLIGVNGGSSLERTAWTSSDV